MERAVREMTRKGRVAATHPIPPLLGKAVENFVKQVDAITDDKT